tara:strand:+ start:440 stop:787 length:348 start_codon:yes stop_codon:yes gene_type:complete
MKKFKDFILIAMFSALLMSCAQKNDIGYEFHDYSQSLYSYEKNLDEESKNTHIETLNKIVNSSDPSTIPPGLRIELALRLDGNSDDNSTFDKLLDEELNQYPESKKIINILRKRL